jgi:TonB family protein
MKQSHLALISALILVVILAFSWCGRRPKTITGPAQSPTPAETASPVASATPAASSSPSPSPTPAQPSATPVPTPTPSENLRRATRKAGPAIILISVFDSSGALLRSGTGFFVARDGRLITNWHVVEGGAHAVAKSADGKIRNIPGILASAPSLDLVLLRAETTIGVPFLPLKETQTPSANIPVAVVGSWLNLHAEPLATTTIVGQKSGPGSDLLETSNPIPGAASGGPVIDESGKVVGVVTSAHETNPASGALVRPVSTIESLLAGAKPSSKASWPTAAATGSASPSALASASPTPTATPSPTPREKRRMKLVYTPAPVYPREAMFGRRENGSGRYRVVFGANGEARRVQIVKSTGNPLLDQAAVEALQKWRAEPGREWSLVVPMTFRPR